MKRLLVFASGRGTDFQAILDHQNLGILQNASIVGVVCNHEGARVIERAESGGIPVFLIEGVAGKRFPSHEDRESARSEFDRECLNVVNLLKADLIVLAGFDQIVSRELVEVCKFRIMNIHPAYDLRQFGGKNMVGLKVHELVLRSGAQFSGCTVHFVTSDLDMGPPILKRKVKLEVGETPESLETKVLALEHLAYPEAIQLFTDNRIVVSEKDGTARCFVDRYSSNWDVHWSARQEKYLNTHVDESKILGWSGGDF